MILLVLILILILITYSSLEVACTDNIISESLPSKVMFSDDVIMRKFNKHTGKIIGPDNIIIINDKLRK